MANGMDYRPPGGSSSNNGNSIFDTTPLDFGDPSPRPMFQLPANAVVHQVIVIVDVAFNGTAPSMSVGVSGGSPSKYVASTQVDLKIADKYVIYPSHMANHSAENLEITYVASGSTVGAARVTVEYSIPQ